MRALETFQRAATLSPAYLSLPEKLDASGILVGWSMEPTRERFPVGFTYGDTDRSAQSGYVDPILMESEGHLLTIAPTGAGKGIGCIVPALLRHPGAAIVIDPKGENAMVTARHRRDMGQEVIIIDPMGITGLPAASLNPLDVIDPSDASGVDNAAAIVAAMLPANLDSEKNRFWLNRGRQLLTAVVLHVVTDLPAQDRTLWKVREIVNKLASDPGVYGTMLRGSRHPEVRMIEGNLKISAQETLGGIISFAQEGVDFMRGPQLVEATVKTSFDLSAITRGTPITIFIVIPPHLLETLSRILRLWISTLLGLIMQRRSKPELPTLFILDEAAQLGELAELRTAITLLRGYGLQTWSFWQDVSQLKLLYPTDWQTMVNNCRVVQSFGPNNLNAARDMTDLVGFLSPERFLALENDEMLLQVAGDEAIIAKRPNYLADPIFGGRFDGNPLFDPRRDPVPKPNHIREYLRPLQLVSEPASLRRKHNLVPGPKNVIDALLADKLLRRCQRGKRR
jgi:type IV secretion system protein VirD4